MARLAKLPRLYRVVRVIRLLKIFKMLRFNKTFRSIVDRLKLSSSKNRILLSCLLAVFFVHLFACFWYLSAKMNDFDFTTWVYRNSH